MSFWESDFPGNNRKPYMHIHHRHTVITRPLLFTELQTSWSEQWSHVDEIRCCTANCTALHTSCFPYLLWLRRPHWAMVKGLPKTWYTLPIYMARICGPYTWVVSTGNPYIRDVYTAHRALPVTTENFPAFSAEMGMTSFITSIWFMHMF